MSNQNWSLTLTGTGPNRTIPPYQNDMDLLISNFMKDLASHHGQMGVTGTFTSGGITTPLPDGPIPTP